MSELTRDQQTLLLYLETCLVDHGGKVEARHMNDDDFKQAKQWHGEGFLRFGRLFAAEACRGDGVRAATNWVLFTDESWEAAHRLRRERADRLAAKVDRNEVAAS